VGGRFGGIVTATDDFKFARLVVAMADYHMVWRDVRRRYDAGAFPSVDLFDVTVQLRATPQAHLIYGFGLARAGAANHASSAGLAFRLGFALPFVGRRAATMRDYRRAYLQIEGLPLVGSLLTNHHEEGYFDFEQPAVQLQGEVALAGRLRTTFGLFDAEARLSASYHRQHSMFLSVGLRWTSHVFAGRLAGTFHSQYLVPLRPFFGDESSDVRRLAHRHHLSLALGMLIYLTVPRIRAEDTRAHRRRTIDEYFEVARRERRERAEARRTQRRERGLEVNGRRTRRMRRVDESRTPGAETDSNE
jgi:hypothetical protein